MDVTSTEFQKNIGRYQDKALQEPVRISKNGRPHTVLLSADLYEVLIKGRIVRRAEDLDAETLKALAESEMSQEHAHLNDLLD